jgi:predicted  nucleic acid-binding Zn-ribbon protein
VLSSSRRRVLTLFSPDKYKEENWNLEVTLQELRIQFSDSQSTVQRLESEHKRLTRQFNKAREATDQHKNEAERLKSGLEELKANHETAIAQARRQAASLQRDKSDLQQSLDTVKAEMARLNRRLPRMGSPMTPEGRERSDLLTPHDREMSDVFSTAPSTSRRRGDTSTLFSGDGEYDSSPDGSPSRPFQAPNHPSNEVEALQQRLSHAQRQINTLKSTLQREKELKIEYRKRLDASPAVSTDVNTEEYVTDDDTEDGTSGTGKISRRLGSFRVARGGRGRGRARGGITLIQRLENAARSPPSDFQGDDDFGALTSTPPPLPALPVFFGGGAEADDEPEPDYQGGEEPAVDPPSNRGSLDGLDPAFANVIRRSSSSGSLPYNRSPLRQAIVSRTLPRRSRGGAAFQEARPASLVGQPEALAAELFGTGMDSVAETEIAVDTAEFGCQTELEEVSEPPPPIQITPAAPENADFGVQVDPEVPELKLMTDTPTQTDPEPILRPEPKVVVEHADTGVQHESTEVPRFYAESSIETDPIVEHQTIPVALPASLPVTLQAGVQTLSMQTAEATVQTLLVPVLEKLEVEVQTVSVPSSSALALDTGGDINSVSVLNDTITLPALPHDSSGDTTIYGGIFAFELESGDRELDNATPETGADTDTEADYQDARQSIVLTTPTPSMEDYQSMQAFSDDEDGGETDDAESIKASMLSYRRDVESRASAAPPPPGPVHVDVVRVTYDSQAVQAGPPEEPTPILVSAPDPEPTPEPVPSPVSEPPKAELKEIAVQTDKWVSTPPVSPVHPRGPSLLGPFKTASTGTHQFQYIAPHSPGPAATSTPAHSVPPSPSAVTSGVRDSVATIIPVPRSLTHDRRQSIESTLSGADDTTPRSRIPVAAPVPIDKRRPPMMMFPPPPRAPPPPNSMPPPPFVPERRIPTSSTSSHDVAPGRPISPPPPELIQRATTPTFGSLRGGLPRQHGSSLPPTAQGLASRPSTHSFRSAANIASHVAPPNVISMFSSRERDRVRGMSTTSLQSDRSLGSGRSSMSSDNHYYPARAQSRATNAPNIAGVLPQNGAANPSARGTDPAILHAITQTMIGEFLYKYTRRTIGKGHGDRRHKRFFWVHPYTRTLYWSDADPGSSNVSESSAKSGECLHH